MEPVDQRVDPGFGLIVDPYDGHLTAVNTRFDHIVGLGVEIVDVPCFFEVDRSPSNSFPFDPTLEYFYKTLWSSAFRLCLIYMLFLIKFNDSYLSGNQLKSLPEGMLDKNTQLQRL